MFRLLRSYERMANKDHPCSRCQEFIKPGDWYRCEIGVQWSERRKKHLTIWKEHIDPECEFPEFHDDDSIHDDEEVDQDLDKAA